jgi:CheY-like chemotaxis protein
MGGNITVTSAVGKGSVFRLKLLLSEVSRPRIASTQEDRVRGYVGPRQSVLVVDDNEIQRNLVRDMLTPLGFTVSTASGGRDCLSLAERDKPNLIFLDIAMPEMDGWQVAQRLRQSSTERTAIVVLSANAIDPGRLVDAERLHDDYLMKPIDLRQLLKTIHVLLNIEWIYGPEEALSNGLEQTLPIRFPSSQDINELVSLGEIGHVRRIQEKLAGLEREAPEYARFVNQMRAFVNAFDLKRYLAALEDIRSRNA